MTLKPSRVALPLFIFMALFGLTACQNDKEKEPTQNPPPDDSISKIELDATAGGISAKPDDPANKYTYFNLDTGKVVVLTDADADSSTDWHIAFKRTKGKLNGGASGPGEAKGADADSQDDFYNADGSPNESVFLNATGESEPAAFNSEIGRAHV